MVETLDKHTGTSTESSSSGEQFDGRIQRGSKNRVGARFTVLFRMHTAEVFS